MQKIKSFLLNIFIFGSLWISIFTIFERFRFFSYAQTYQGLQIYKASGNDGVIGSLIAAFFVSALGVYLYASKIRKN